MEKQRLTPILILAKGYKIPPGSVLLAVMDLMLKATFPLGETKRSQKLFWQIVGF